MTIDTINDMIDELRDAEPSLSNIRNLAALYSVRTNLLGTQRYDETTKELSDVLPSYLQYINTKRKYQLREVTDQAVYDDLERLCKEVKEFLHILYSSTDTNMERQIIKNLIQELYRTF